MSTEINVMWYAAKLKSLRKAIKVAADSYALPEDDRIALLRMVRYELSHLSNRLGADLKLWDDAERAAMQSERNLEQGGK